MNGLIDLTSYGVRKQILLYSGTILVQWYNILVNRAGPFYYGLRRPHQRCVFFNNAIDISNQGRSVRMGARLSKPSEKMKPKEGTRKTKEKIIRAALKVFAKGGFSDAKIRDIATKAGVPHNLIRYHFGSKDDLWKAVVNYGMEQREARVKQTIDAATSSDPVELFKSLIKSHILFTAEHPDLVKIMFYSNSKNSRHLDYIIEKRETVHTLTAPLFEKAKARGYFKGFDHDGFIIYMRALSETPIATSELTNRLQRHDIFSEEGIALHTQRVIDFLFRKDVEKEIEKP